MYMVLVKSLLLALLLSLASFASAADAKTALPCDATSIAVAADGSGLWFGCSQGLAAEKRAEAAGKPAPNYAGTDSDPTDVYWLANGSTAPVKAASAKGVIDIMPALVGSQALFVMPQASGKSKVALFNGQQRVKDLPLNPEFLLWSADAQKIYFYGGSTVQADAWNVLAIYDLKTGAVEKKTLRTPTEILRVCPANGNVYSVTPKYPGFAGSTLEYTPELRFVRRVHGWIGAHFSAACAYVASEADFHGPLPWDIYDVSSGKILFSFAGLDEEGKTEAYRFVQWIPKHESLLLREHVMGQNRPDKLEVFDVKSGRVLQTVPDTEVVAWSADGNSFILGEGSALVWHTITPQSTAGAPSNNK